MYTISTKFSRYHTFNKFEYFQVFGPSVHLMYPIFHWIFSISYIQWIWIFRRIWTFDTSIVHSFPLHFHDFVHSMNSIFRQIRAFCTFNVHKFPLNFHDIVHLTNSNFSTYLDHLYIQYTQFSIGFSGYHTFNEFKFFYEFSLSVHLIYTIF